MKRIAVSAICVVMCCIFLCQHVAAAQGQANFNVTACTMMYARRYSASTGALEFQSSELNSAAILGSDGFYLFSGLDAYFHSDIVGASNYTVVCRLDGSWDNDPSEGDLLWLTCRVTFGIDQTINYEDLLNTPVVLTAVSRNGSRYDFTNYALAKESDTQYLLTWMVKVTDITDFNLVTDTASLYIELPYEPVVTSGSIYVTEYRVMFYLEITYNIPEINYDALILDSVDTSNELLQEVVSNQDITVKEIIATREVIAENGEKLQEISNKQDTVITVLEQLPAELRDLEVGDPYDKSLDTSEIVAYESAYDAVMEEVDVDQVVNIMDGGISLNQDGMYNEQSFNSVSGLVMDIIDATGLMPLIMISLTFGLACFIIGRSGNL